MLSTSSHQQTQTNQEREKEKLREKEKEMSKADYLKKYLSSDLNNEKKKKKLKLSSSYSSSSSRNERERKEGKEGRGVIIIDEDIINDTPSAENIEEAWERQGQEDQPVTVELEDNNENISRGKWVSIPLNVPKRKKDQDNSPPRRRNQDNNSPPRRNKTEDNSPPRKNKNNQDNSPPRRNKTNEDNSPPRRNRNNQDSPPRRNRNNEDNSPPRKNKIKNNEDNSPPRRKEEENIRENKEEFDSKGRRTKTSSGHNAGLQSIESFGEKERELQKKRERELKELGNIEQEETVYRDKRGRKLDMLNEFMRQQATTEGKVKKHKNYCNILFLISSKYRKQRLNKHNMNGEEVLFKKNQF